MRNSVPFYFLDFGFGDFFYGANHPMKPIRVNMVHDLVFSYGLNSHLKIKYPVKTFKKTLYNFHTKNYLEFLFCGKKGREKYINNGEGFSRISKEDCPIFSGIAEYCQMYSSGSISGARDLIKRKTMIAINWAGGLHHAKRGKSSGFCYINDVVLSILELLKNFRKVLYIDIDIHHGDGVEEAFYLSKRVFCLSFHNFSKNFFPGTGNLNNTGISSGFKSTINVPLKTGIKDKTFRFLFEPIVSKIVQFFDPDVIVVQGGADSLNGDSLGRFGLSIFGHGSCIEFIKSFEIPVLILGGGGYLKTNVARCWTLETSILSGKNISQFLPYNNYWRFFSPSFKLYPSLNEPLDKNSKKKPKSVKKANNKKY